MKKKGFIKRVCKYCKKEFDFRGCPSDVSSGRGKFCSRKCTVDSTRKYPKYFKCQMCGKDIENKYGKFRKYCSIECQGKSRIGVSPGNKGKKTPKHIVDKQRGRNNHNWKGGKPKCKVCKKTLKYGSTFCREHFRKENHPNWRGGVTPVQEKIRKSYKYVAWRKSILKRDDRTCVNCGEVWNKKWGVKTNLNVDHIKPFSTILFENKIKTLKDAYKCEELWDKNNARTLCVPCHKETETNGVSQRIKLKKIHNELQRNN